MEKEDAFKRSVLIFLVAMFAGVISFFVGKFYETLNWDYFIVLLVLSFIVISFFYVFQRKYY